MPSPRKVDLLPAELRDWLKAEIGSGLPGGYEDLAARLNDRLDAAGLEIRIQKSALHAYGREHREFVKVQEEASAWAESWLTDEGLAGEAKRHGVLFQMMTSLAFKSMRGMMSEGAEVDPKELQFLGRMLKDVMASAGLREKLVEEERKAQAAKLETAVAAGRIDAEAAAAAREIMGFA